MTYIIAEIGQNHNGSVDLAKLIIDVVARPVEDKLFSETMAPVNAVKFTKRDLNYELSNSQMEKPYINKHSFGKTYGEHRQFLELTDDQHHELFNYSKSKNLEFVETICAPSCLSLRQLRGAKSAPLMYPPISRTTGDSTSSKVKVRVSCRPRPSTWTDRLRWPFWQGIGSL